MNKRVNNGIVVTASAKGTIWNSVWRCTAIQTLGRKPFIGKLTVLAKIRSRSCECRLWVTSSLPGVYHRRGCFRIAISTGAMLGAMLLGWKYIVPLLGRISPRLGSGNWQSDWIPAVSLLVVCIIMGLGTYLLSAKILRCPELKELFIRKEK